MHLRKVLVRDTATWSRHPEALVALLSASAHTQERLSRDTVGDGEAFPASGPWLANGIEVVAQHGPFNADDVKECIQNAVLLVL